MALWMCGGVDSEHDLFPPCTTLVATGSGQGQGILWGVSVEACGSRVCSSGLSPARGAGEKGSVLPSLEGSKVNVLHGKGVETVATLKRKSKRACPQTELS